MQPARTCFADNVKLTVGDKAIREHTQETAVTATLCSLCTQDADRSLSPRYTTDFLLSLGTRSVFEMRLALIQRLRRKEEPYKAVGFAPASVAHRNESKSRNAG